MGTKEINLPIPSSSSSYLLKVEDYSSVDTNGVIKVGSGNGNGLFLTCYQGGNKIGTWTSVSRYGTTIKFNEAFKTAKKGLLGGYSKISLHVLNQASSSLIKEITAKSAYGIPYSAKVELYFYMRSVDTEVFYAWAKKNNFKQKGNVWLTLGQMQNLVANLFFEKCYESYVKKITRDPSTCRAFRWDRLNASGMVVEVAKMICAQLSLLGFDAACTLKIV